MVVLENHKRCQRLKYVSHRSPELAL
uniref:Uncharacterized protein n=1 Tax=Rhizophora mucronata TaxID=61149 RepID=A0A2P2PKU8_RHIMU